MHGNRLYLIAFRVVLLPLFLFYLLIACGEEDNVGKVSEELANRLTESLLFDGGEVKDGEAPSEHSGDNSIPQITELNAPSSLSIGQSFTLSITGQVEDPDTVAGAVVEVELANKYIEVESEYNAETNIMELSGTISEDEELEGYDFNIYIGLLDNQGRVGNYILWELKVLDSNDDSDGDYSQSPELKCQEICEFNYECGTMGDMSVDDCLQSCADDTAKALSQDGPECVTAITNLVDCAIPLGCDGYLNVMSSENPDNCSEQSVLQQDNCPTFEFSQQ